MTLTCSQDMLCRANRIKAQHNKENVSFVESQITDLSTIPSETAHCVISNCVINLVPEDEKHLVFKEMHRVLRPGGRVAISDILAKKPLPEQLRSNMALHVGCVAGASLTTQYEKYLQEAGFPTESFVFTHDESDLNVYLETDPDGTRGDNLCCNPRVPSPPTLPAAASCPDGHGRPPCCSGPNDEVKMSVKVTEELPTSASSTSCCGGGNKAAQACAFDEKDLADLEGQDLNAWAGKLIDNPS